MGQFLECLCVLTQKLAKVTSEMASNGLRTLCVAYRDIITKETGWNGEKWGRKGGIRSVEQKKRGWNDGTWEG